MRRAVQKRAKFDITDLNTIKVAKSCFVPVLFGHAIDDDFIRPHHSERIYEAYIVSYSILSFTSSEPTLDHVAFLIMAGRQKHHQIRGRPQFTAATVLL